MYEQNPAGYDSWVRSFLESVGNHPVARATWDKLRRAGLQKGAFRLLSDYAGVGADVPDLDAIGRAPLWSLLESAVRAEHIAQQRTNDTRAHMFMKRREESRTAALSSPWIADDEEAQTFLGALRRDKLPEGSHFSAIRKALKKAAGPRSAVANPKYFLFLLQGYAEKHGVPLGLKRLTSLADCALRGNEHLDEGTLGRYIRSIRRRGAILRDTLPLLPPPTSR